MRKMFATLMVLTFAVMGCAPSSETEPTTAETPVASMPASVETSSPTSEPVPAGDILSDDGWTLSNLEVTSDGLGDFAAVGRVTNDIGHDVEGALFALTLLDNSGAVVATLDGSVTAVADGETATAEFFSLDDYVEGDWTVEFAFDGSF